jgi:hypothetical protein
MLKAQASVVTPPADWSGPQFDQTGGAVVPYPTSTSACHSFAAISAGGCALFLATPVTPLQPPDYITGGPLIRGQVKDAGVGPIGPHQLQNRATFEAVPSSPVVAAAAQGPLIRHPTGRSDSGGDRVHASRPQLES